jgi:hypothetical protein
VTGVNRAVAKDVADERASALGILGVDDRVRTNDHATSVATAECEHNG